MLDIEHTCMYVTGKKFYTIWYTLAHTHTHTHSQLNESRVVKHYQFVDWTEDSVPMNAAGIIDLIGVLQKTQHMSGGGPIVAHDRYDVMMIVWHPSHALQLHVHNMYHTLPVPLSLPPHSHTSTLTTLTPFPPSHPHTLPSIPTGRAGTFCVLSNILEQLKVEGIVDLFFAVHSLRQQQPGIVHTIVSCMCCLLSYI